MGAGVGGEEPSGSLNDWSQQVVEKSAQGMKPCGTKAAGKAKPKLLEGGIMLKAKGPMVEKTGQIGMRWGGCSGEGR